MRTLAPGEGGAALGVMRLREPGEALSTPPGALSRPGLCAREELIGPLGDLRSSALIVLVFGLCVLYLDGWLYCIISFSPIIIINLKLFLLNIS